MKTSAALLITIMLAGIVSGCIGQDSEPDTERDGAVDLYDVHKRNLFPFDVTDVFSRTVTTGAFDILDVISVDVPVSLPPTEGGAAATMDARVHLGLFLPDVPEGVKVPVIADIGPYYGDGDVAATEPSNRLGRFLIENFVPQGYAVAQVSVFGSGASNHCMDLMGLSEQLGIDAAVTWLGGQDWSNGNVGLIGRSYDGSTPWQAAMFGNPALKTIVPISGLIGMHDLMWRNGTAETRAPIMHNVVYGTFGIDSNPEAGFIDNEDLQTACQDYVLGPGEGAAALVTGDWVVPQVNSYWAERHFLTRVLANYEGSVYLIQGLQDWNVDPHMAFPTHQLLEAKGLDVKGLYGQWAHMYPDRPSEHIGLRSGYGEEAERYSPRFDWAEDLLQWFDHYLMGTGPAPALHAEVQDNMGAWRVEETYPPADLEFTVLGLDSATPGQDVTMLAPAEPPVPGIAAPELLYEFPALSESTDTRIAGLTRLHLTVTPHGPGGQIGATLYDAETGLRLGHAIMDLRYAEGGWEMQPVAPGMPLVAKMEFEAMDVVLPAGHGLRLVLTPTVQDYLPSVTTNPLEIDTSGASVLKLPIVERGPEAFFEPPAWDPCTYPPFIEDDRDVSGFGCA